MTPEHPQAHGAKQGSGDSLRAIVGILMGEQSVPEDLAERHDQYLARATAALEAKHAPKERGQIHG